MHVAILRFHISALQELKKHAGQKSQNCDVYRLKKSFDTIKTSISVPEKRLLIDIIALRKSYLCRPVKFCSRFIDV